MQLECTLSASAQSELANFLATHAEKRDEQGRAAVVRNGHLPEREVLTGIGAVAVRMPKVGSRTDTTEQIMPTRLFYSPRSRILYAYRHFGWWQATGALLATLLVEPISRTALAIFRRSPSELRATMQAYVKMLAELPRIVRTAWRRNGQ